MKDPAKDPVFLWWVVDQVKILARDPQFQKDFQEWQRKRAEEAEGVSTHRERSLTSLRTGSG